MQTFASLFLSLIAATAVAAVGTTTPAPDGPRFAASEEVPGPLAIDDAYALYEIRLGGQPLSESDQITRWLDELKAGRARAGTLAGSFLAYRALIAADCSAARDALERADELGSDQAPWALVQLFDNTSCVKPERAQLERWLKKAVTLDYPSAVKRLIELYSQAENDAELLPRYVYARVAAGYWDVVAARESLRPRPGFDAAALADMEQKLKPAERTAAEIESGKLLAQMLKRHERLGGTVAPVKLGVASAGGKSANNLVVYSVDYRHECQWNLTGNCRGAQRLAYADLTNKSRDFLTCKVALHTPDFVSGLSNTLGREVLIGPGVTRRLLLGDINNAPDKNGLVSNCAVVPDLAANAAAGKCRAHLKSTLNVEDFYPPSAVQRGTEGSAVVRYWVPPDGETPLEAEIVTSSGDVTLDEAAIATVRSGQFTKDCAYGISNIRIAFKLQN